MNTEPIEKIGFLLHDAQRLLRKRFDANAAQYGLSSAQWRLMVRVVKEPGIAQARLAELLEIEPISVSRLVDRMAEAGWVERRADDNDRRVRMVFPTARSRGVFTEVKGMAHQIFDEALTGLSLDQRHAFVHGLETIIANLSETDGASLGEAQLKEGTPA
ncbi:MarR family transcriptional regulator [Tianweitania sp. Rool2]|uniref:MarR family transcriptional regulator n=2 Tax=Oryzicola mucosus TaxID=2767425 RepID=A0A8J6PVP6_9HYPH|nr:MarR family transcriptional regulator [Oryzicola mucosus]MBD0415726.1 MarR family transcriptional regulator [Oryzicola mucosus]